MSRILILVMLMFVMTSPAECQMFVRGDSNSDQSVDVADAVLTLAYLFQAEPAPSCFSAADSNDDGAVDVSDAVYVLAFLFSGGPTIPPPYPSPGVDPTPDALPCAGGTSLDIDHAEFEDEDTDLEDELRVEGSSDLVSVVTLLDDESGVVLGQVMTEPNGDWQWTLMNPWLVPCTVRAEGNGAVDTRAVSSAPSDCGPPDNLPPTCTITGPAVAIQVGVPVTFNAVAHDPEGEPLSVSWHFGGAIDSTLLSVEESDLPFAATPTFEVGGQAFRVALTVVDAGGLRSTCRLSVLVGSFPDPAGRPPVAEQPAPGTPTLQDYTVIAVNDLGMHCADIGSVPFSILPPFNVLNAQVILRGVIPILLDDSDVSVVYSAASNPADLVVFDPSQEPPSINSTSVNFPVGAPVGSADIAKTDFWDPFGGSTVVAGLFGGLDPPPDEGLPTIHNPGGIGRRMPGIADPYAVNEPQPFSMFQPEFGWFTAEGIPITSFDDYGRMNAYPLMRVQAIENASSNVVATVDAVVPVSQEVDCRDCHRLGEVGADPVARPLVVFEPPPAFTDRAADEAAAKLNILRLHDFNHGTTLDASQPVLCASCHNSFALEDVTGGALAGDPTLSTMSSAMHTFHGMMTVDALTGALVRDLQGEPFLTATPDPGLRHLLPTDPTDSSITMEQNCFTCHPGKITQCFRGAMLEAGLKCSSCHGSMLATGGAIEGDFDHTGVLRSRLPWRDEPRCESCHRGDAVNPGVDSMLAMLAFDPTDLAAVPTLAPNPRFAEEPQKLYRHSAGHGNVSCETCHGSTHAIWPNPDPLSNDNVISKQLQGYAGTLRECSVCHTSGSFPDGTLAGPHGMHPVNDPNWIKGDGDWHKDYAQDWSSGDPCASCHGVDHKGTRLSVTPIDRELRDADGNLRAVVTAGQVISCDMCHSLEDSFNN